MRSKSTVWTKPREDDIKFKHTVLDYYSVVDPKNARNMLLMPNATHFIIVDSCSEKGSEVEEVINPDGTKSK